MINLAAAIVCIAAMTGLPEAPVPEVCVGHSHGAVCGWTGEFPGAVGLYYPASIRVNGLGIVWVAEGYEYLVVHELVHHLQHMAGRTMFGEGETQARQVQREFWAACPEAQEEDG